MFTVVVLKIHAFWDVMLCQLVYNIPEDSNLRSSICFGDNKLVSSYCGGASLVHIKTHYKIRGQASVYYSIDSYCKMK